MNLTQVTVVIGQRIVTTDATTKAQTTTYSIISNPVTEILAPLPNNANVYTDQVRELEARVLNEFMKSEKGKGYNLTDLMVYNYNITLGGRRVFG